MGFAFAAPELSDIGGDGGVGASEVAEVSDLAGGGVDGVGDEVVVTEADAEISEAGDLSLYNSAEIMRFLDRKSVV